MRRLSDIICNQRPLTLTPSHSVKDGCNKMRERKVGSVLLVDETGQLIGIFTGRDAVARVLAEGKNAAKTPLGDVMTKDPIVMGPEMTAIDALRLMWDGGFRHVPVVQEGDLLGVVSRGDFRAMEADRLEEERELWDHLR